LFGFIFISGLFNGTFNR